MASINSKHTKLLARQTGFSLVEIMVGMVIGLLATLVITQVFALFEGQRRTTTGNADAQTNGSIALYTIQRDIQMAGFGLPVFDTQNPPLRCTTNPTIDHDGIAGTPAIGMFPLTITDGGAAAGASDSIVVRYGDTANGGIPIRINNITGAPVSGVGVDNNAGCRFNDIAFISNGTSCNMTRVSDTNADLDANPINIELADVSGAAVVTNASIACMGNWNEFVYAVGANQLLRNGTPSVAEIVNIQVQYGVSATANSNQVTQWVDAAGATWAAVPLDVADRNRIKAIRVAVVARNGLLEKENVSTACSSTTLPAPTGVCAWEGSVASPAPTVDLSNDANWQRYRYRVFETIIPMRNMIWSRNTL